VLAETPASAQKDVCQVVTAARQTSVAWTRRENAALRIRAAATQETDALAGQAHASVPLLLAMEVSVAWTTNAAKDLAVAALTANVTPHHACQRENAAKPRNAVDKLDTNYALPLIKICLKKTSVNHDGSSMKYLAL
jgi:hypothetical protein